ncbi:hypothetical protein [Microbacterium paraoxydans]|uniref:hypothetical protein n=1 Tax=Microbacterium paraoxydans TaxID=199592 RepID=UPI001CF94B44|nr:hypothetical protein [Microbacterium paraoxydans]
MTPATPLIPAFSMRLAALAASVALLAGCSPGPEPTPTPTAAFASEEEAFAAAEATYRAYNDASNARRSGDVTARPDSYLVGAALEADLEASDYLRAEGLQVTGDVKITTFRGLRADIDTQNASLTALVCLDVSRTRVVDAAGTDVTPTARARTIALFTTMSASGDTFQVEDETDAPVEEC